MFCSNCGNQISDEVKFCPSCGKKVESDNTSQNINYGYDQRYFVPLKTDYNFWIYLLLTIVTCGIFHYVLIYRVSEDMNVACAGDGDETAGLVKYILLTLVTCGIYAWVWHYKLGNRLQINARRYGMEFQENGTTILLWMLLGSFIFGIGTFIAMYIIINNVNKICEAYNNYNYSLQ